MIINAKDGKQIYYTHIPRTGGRYVRELFLYNDYVIDLHDFSVKFYHHEVPHLYYPLNELYLGINGYDHTMPKFCVVRHPVSRIKSFIRIWQFGLGLTKVEVNSMENFVCLMEKLKSVINHNFLIPQSGFIGGCEIWKFENGLGHNFCQWIENLYNFKLPIIEPNIDMSECSEIYLPEIEYSENFDQYAKLYFENEIKILGY